MLQAYVGIVSLQGLEIFCPEHPQTVRFLQRRVARTRGQARTAVARAWRSLLMRPHPRALWHLGRAAASLVAPARGTP